MEVPPWRRGVLEQADFTVRVAVKAQSLLVPILPGDEITILPSAGVIPAIRVEREVLHVGVRRGWGFVKAEQVNDEPNVHGEVRGRGIVEPAEVRGPGGPALAGEVQQEVREEFGLSPPRGRNSTRGRMRWIGIVDGERWGRCKRCWGQG